MQFKNCLQLAFNEVCMLDRGEMLVGTWYLKGLYNIRILINDGSLNTHG
jgi:hypothetical protein